MKSFAMNSLFYSGAATGGGRRASALLFALAIFVNVLPTEQTKADLSSHAGEPAAATKSTSSIVRREVPSEPAEGPIELFDAFVAGHGHGYVRGTAEYELRRGNFAKSVAKIHAQNSKPNGLWKAGLNFFSDRTEDEKAGYRGWRGPHKPRHGGAAAPSLSEHEAPRDLKTMPENFDWSNLTTSKVIKNQGSCGSCWAVTTITVLEAHFEIFMLGGTHLQGSQNPRSFAAQELVSCIANPNHCGGSGGCDGATVELGMEYAIKNGLGTDEEVPYKARDMSCVDSKNQPALTTEAPMLVLVQGNGMVKSMPSGSPAQPKVKMLEVGFGLTAYETLPVNKEEPLVRALVEKGPVAVSVAADDWHFYESGIHDTCKADCVVDHAVTMIGYSKDATLGKKYWLVRNSWGDSWGESGHIRVLRRENEEAFCGIDNDPKKGVACDGSPDKVTVCGTCGILYDSVVPTFTKSSGGGGSALTKTGSNNRPEEELTVVLAEKERLVRREHSAT